MHDDATSAGIQHESRPGDPTGLMAFIDASPTPFHAVASLAARLEAAGFVAFDERQRWTVEPGTAGYVVRDGGSINA